MAVRSRVGGDGRGTGARTPVRLMLGLVLLAALVRPSAAIEPLVRNLILSDRQADPLGLGGARGGIFLIRYESSVPVRLASFAEGFVDPVAAEPLPDRTILVVDSAADPLNLGQETGALLRIDPRADLTRSRAELVAASALFVDPVDVLIEPEGTYLLLDSNADPHRNGNAPGAIFRVDPATHNVELVAAPGGWVQPRSLTWDVDGSVLVLDQNADPANTGQRGGAIFRLNRTTGAVTTVFAFTRPRFASPSAIAVLSNGDYLIADRDADPEGRGNFPGAVFRLPRTGAPPVVFSADADFLEPLDLELGLENDVWVLDTATNPDQIPNARGAVFRYDLQTGTRRQRLVHSLFRGLTGIAQIVGAEVDSSVVAWSDESQGLTRPGDFFTVRAHVRNTGNSLARGIVLTDTLTTDWTYVAGSDSASLGSIRFDPESRVVQWREDLEVAGEARLRFRIRLGDHVTVGRRVRQDVVLALEGAVTRRSVDITPQATFSPGAVVFADLLRVAGAELGTLWMVNPDSTLPTRLYTGAPLVRPTDTVFLEDGRLAVLDTRAFAGRIPGPEGVFIYNEATEDGIAPFDTLFVRRPGDGLSSVQGICLDRNGNLLLIDKDANPLGCTEGSTAPGAVYRLDVRTGTLNVLFSDCRLREPTDAEVDARGRVVVVDFAGAESGGIWRYDRSTQILTPFPQNPVFFPDPLGIAFDAEQNPLIADLSGNPRHLSGNTGIVFRIVSEPEFGYQLISQDERFRDPNGLVVSSDGRIFVSDREADPLHLGDTDPGAVFVIDPTTDPPRVEIAAAGNALNSPDGLTVLARPNLTASRLNVFDINSGRAEPGDTLRYRLSLVNSAPRGAPQVLADFSFQSSLLPVSASADAGVVSLDTRLNQAAWTGRIAAYDTIEVSVLAQVRTDATYGSFAGASARLSSGSGTISVSTGVPVRAPFAPGDLLLADEAADPLQLGGGPGAIFRLGNSGDEASFLLSSNARRQSSAIEFTNEGDLLIAFKQAENPGGVYRLDTATGALLPVIENDSRLRTPVDLLFEADGSLLILDSDAEGPTPDARGALFRLRKGASTLERVSADVEFRSPSQVCFDARGRLFLADRNANPDHDPTIPNPGAVFQIDPVEGNVLGHYQHRDLPEPVGLTSLSDSSLIVTDQAANPLGLPRVTGALFEYLPDRALHRIFFASSVLVQPRRTQLLPNGLALILDRAAERTGQTTGAGAVLEYSARESIVRFYASSDSFRALSDIAYLPSSFLQFVKYDVTDGNGVPLYPADRLHVETVLRNAGQVTARSVAYLDSLPGEGAVLPNSLEASAGELLLDANVVRWTGEISAGDSVRIGYDLQLDPFRAEGKVLTFRARATEEVVGTLEKSIRLPIEVPFEPGHIYVADGDADPYGLGGAPGAVLKVDLLTGNTVPYFSSRRFRQPRDVALVGGLSPRILVLDAQARPTRGTGALFSIDPVTREMDLVAFDSTWTQPSQLLPISDDEYYVLDTIADPYRLTTGAGPGAIYRVRLSDGSVSVVFSDTTLVTPTSIARLPSGFLAICDADADPSNFGNRNGAVYELDLIAGSLQLLATSPQWQTPVAILAKDEGGLVLADRDAQPFGSGVSRGAVFNIAPDGRVSFVSDSRFFRSLSNIQFRSDGTPILSDQDADPFGLGNLFGAIHQWNSEVIGKFVPLAGSPLMRRPSGFFIYQDLVPVLALNALAETVLGGVRIRWTGPEELPGARYLLYRRLATGPDDPGDATPDGYELLPASGLDGPGEHEYLDDHVEASAWYVYLIALADESGTVMYGAPIVAQAPAVVDRLQLFRAQPNPLRAGCILRYRASSSREPVKLSIYDVAGRRVRRLVDEPSAPGLHAEAWDGRDDRGRAAAGGVYFARLTQGPRAETERLVVIR